jgi:hypothetical protein
MPSFWIAMLLALTLGAMLFLIPIVIDFEGSRVNCDTVVWKFIPSDPIGSEGHEYREFLACRRAGMVNLLATLALFVAVPVGFVIHNRRFRARRSSDVPERPDHPAIVDGRSR